MRVGRFGRRLVPWLAASAIAASCGDDPPDREIQQAETAIEAARTGGPDDYAHEEFAAAEKALQSARDAVSQRDYRLALTNAIDSRARAETAANEAKDQKRIAHNRVERELRTTTASLSQLNSRLKAAESGKASNRVLSASRRMIAEADRVVQEARTAFDMGNYIAAEKAIQRANARLTEASRALDALASPASRRKTASRAE